MTFPAEVVALNFFSEEKMDDVLPLPRCPVGWKSPQTYRI
jgi:hypothetical protein